MMKHVKPWLAMYHDGELGSRRLRRIEAHLAECATCRAELEELRELTALLQEVPAPKTLSSPDHFVAQVGLRLPRRQRQPIGKRVLGTAWRLAPVGILGAWAFGQAVFIITESIMWALRTRVGSDLLSNVLPVSGHQSWLAEVFELSKANMHDVGLSVVHLLDNGRSWTWSMMLEPAFLILVGLLYCSWLVSLWVYHQRVEETI